MQTKFAIAEVAAVITHWFVYECATIVLVVTLQLNHLVIDTDNQPRRDPLRDEITPLAAAGHLTEQGKRHGANGHTQKGGRGYSRRIGLDILCDSVFTMINVSPQPVRLGSDIIGFHY